MREYSKVFCALWASQDFRALNEDGRALVLYLLTCPHGTMIGAFMLPDGYVAEDIQWTPERVREGFCELLGKGFADRCPTTKWVWIRKYLEWNTPENPNQWIAARKLVERISTKCVWLAEFKEVFAIASGGKPKPPTNPSGTVPESGTGTGTGTGTKNPSAAAPPVRTNVSRETPPDWFLNFKLAYPERVGDYGWRKAQKAANARMAEGHTPEQFIAGAQRYAEFCKATDKYGTEYVKQAATFLGPDKPFLLPWTPPGSKGQRQLDANIAASQAWLEKSDAA